MDVLEIRIDTSANFRYIVSREVGPPSPGRPSFVFTSFDAGRKLWCIECRNHSVFFLLVHPYRCRIEGRFWLMSNTNEPCAEGTACRVTFSSRSCVDASAREITFFALSCCFYSKTRATLLTAVIRVSLFMITRGNYWQKKLSPSICQCEGHLFR